MKTYIATLSIGLALSLLTACGSDGGTANQNIVAGQSAVKSVEGVVVRDSQGQFCVGGVPLDTNGATLTINGKRCPMGDLQPGMTVEARGSMSGGMGNGNMGGGMGCGMGDNGQRFCCSEISVNSILIGEIETIDVGHRTLQVGGMVVVADDSTFIVRSTNGGAGAGCVPIAFGALNVGDVVNICGALQEDGAIAAYRICLLPSGTVYEACFTTQGVVSGLEPGVMTFTCNGCLVNYGDATVIGELANGATALVSGSIAEGVIYATSVTVKDTTDARMVYGNICGLNQDACRFNLNGGGCCGSVNYMVDYSGAKVDVDLATHRGRVCVQGTVSQNGGNCTIMATWVTK